MLGVFEAGLFPGVAFYLSWSVVLRFSDRSPHPFLLFVPCFSTLTVLTSWYKRNELGFRIALFNSANQLSGAFAGLLAVRFGLGV